MDLLNHIKNIITHFLDFVLSVNFIVLLVIFIFLYNFLMYLIRDRKYARIFKENKDPEAINLLDLKDLPLVNIIIPAWKEGKLFEDCLLSITKLNYPNLKVIVNAGGNDETIKISNEFKKYKNFIILKQKPEGKIRALNECMNFLSEGIVYSIDADVILTDEILLRMTYPLINEDQFVTSGSIRPLKEQENIDIVKYIVINRNTNFRIKFSRLGKRMISGPNSCFKYEVIKKIGNFSEEHLFPATDRFRATLIVSKGYKIFWLTDYRGRIFTYYPDSLKEYIIQELRWRENALTNPYTKKNYKFVLKIIFSFLFSLYIIIIPIFLFFNLILFSVGIIILFNHYLIRLRKTKFFKLTVNNRYYKKFGFLFFIKITLYIYIDALITILVVFNIILHKTNRKKIR